MCGDSEAAWRTIASIAERQRGSVALHRRALESLSGLPMQLPYASPILPLCVERAEGCRIVDVDGNEYVDCHMAYTAGILGHSPAPVVDAVRRELERGIGAGQFVRAHVELAELVRRMVPGLERVALFHSGGEAVAAAVRLARAATGRTVVAKFEGCYHGSNDVGLHNTMILLQGRVPGGPLDRIQPEPATGGLTPAAGAELLILPYNSPIALERLRERAGEIACVIADPAPPFLSDWIDECRRFVEDLRAAASEAGVPLVLDEVVSGFRLARGGAQQAYPVAAEMACYGKITSGLGIPLTMVGGKARFLDFASTDGLFQDYRAGKAWLSTTNAASFLAVVAALEALRYLDRQHEAIMGRIDRGHADLADRVAEMARTDGIPVALVGHPRLQPMLVLGEAGGRDRTYRGIVSASPWQFRSLLALTLYLRLEGVYAKTVPTMNLSAAHTEEDVALIASAIRRSLLRMREDGLLPP